MSTRVRLSGTTVNKQLPSKTEYFVNTLAQDYQYSTENISESLTGFEEGIAVLDAQVSAISAQVAILSDTVTDNSDSIININSTISTINSSLTTAYGNITTLQSTLSTLQSTVGTQGTRLTTAESNITSIQSSLTTLQSTVNTLQSTVIGTWSTSYPGTTITYKMAAIDTLNSTYDSRLTALEGTSSSALLSGWTATYPGMSVTQKMTLVDGVNGVQTTRLDNYDNGTTATSQIRLANNTPFGSRIHCDSATNVSLYFDSTTRTGQLYKNGNDMVMRCNTGRMQLLSDTSSISLYGQKYPTGGVGVLNTHGVYVTGRDDDATQNVQSLLAVVGNAASTTYLNMASGHLASSLGSGTYCTVNGVSTTGVSFAGGNNIYDATLNPTGTDHAIRCYSAANKTALSKTASFEMSDFAGYSVYKTVPYFDAAKTATDPLISMTYLDYRLNTAYYYVYLEGRRNGCTPGSYGQGINSRFLGSNFNYQQVQSHPYGTQGSLVFFDNTNGYIAMYAGKTYKITIVAYPQVNAGFYMRLRLFNLSTYQPLFGTNGVESDFFAVNVSTNVNEPNINAFIAMYTPASSHSVILSLHQLSGLSANDINYVRWLVEIYNNVY